MRLFISHASEDKPDFVEPLVASLEKIYDLWFDQRELSAGDSLFGKISEGLASCDFGIVVLSPHYAKKWPRAELGGLFALETNTRKVILPIWKDITEQEVKQSYPILADRLALRAEDGVEKVIEGIRFAVDASARQRELTGLELASERLKGLNQSLTERQESAALLSTSEGARLVKEAIDVLSNAIQTIVSEIDATSGALNFECKRSDTVTFSVEGPYGLNLHLGLRSLVDNSAGAARLTTTVFRSADRYEQEFEIILTEEFTPSFRRTRQVVWNRQTGDSTMSTEELGAHALDVFRIEIERNGLPA